MNKMRHRKAKQLAQVTWLAVNKEVRNQDPAIWLQSLISNNNSILSLSTIEVSEGWRNGKKKTPARKYLRQTKWSTVLQTK